LSVEVVTKPDSPEFWSGWNNLVRKYGSNPFLLQGFVEYYSRASSLGRWTPQLILLKAKGDLLGAVALKTRGHFGVRTSTQLLPGVYGTDFVSNPDYLEELVLGTLKLVFGKLRCQFLDLTLPTESRSLTLLTKTCDGLGLKLEASPLKWHHREHSVLRVEGTWDEYRKGRGGNFVRHFRKIEGKLTISGEWQIERLVADGPEAAAKVSVVENNSWKVDWRNARRIKEDPDLKAFLEFWRFNPHEETDCPRVWLLELNGEPIAYTISLQLNGIAMLCKTSYDARYAKLYPGEYVQNAAIRDLFRPHEVSSIDFLTPLPYHRRWTTERLTRERVGVSRTVPILTDLATALERNRLFMSTYKSLRGFRSGEDISGGKASELPGKPGIAAPEPSS